jgi:hypothetical protein
MRNFAVWTFGTNAGCVFSPSAATFAATIVMGAVDDRSRRVCSHPA